MTIKPSEYTIRIKGRLGATALSAFPAMLSEEQGRDTVLRGFLKDRAAVFGVIGQIEALGLEMLEFRDIRVTEGPHECGLPGSPDVHR